MVVFDSGEECDDTVIGGEVGGHQLGQVAEHVAAADGDQGRHVGRVGRVHLEPEGVDQNVGLHLEDDPVLALGAATLPETRGAICQPENNSENILQKLPVHVCL